MANLVGGVLEQLVQHMATEVKVGGEHRSCLLQVIGIVPALAGSDLFRQQGFYLRVSDSRHATYVSLPEEQQELILSDKIQLGQFVHVDRLDAASPVPILRGVRPLPGRHPCLGSPLDLHNIDIGIDIDDEKKNKKKTQDDAKKKKTRDDEKKKKTSHIDVDDEKKKKVLGRVKSMGSPRSCYSLPTSFEKFASKVQASHSRAAKPKPKPATSSTFDFGAKALRKSWEGTVDLRPRTTTPSNPSTPRRRSTSSDKLSPKKDMSSSKQESRPRSSTPTPTPTPTKSVDERSKAKPSSFTNKSPSLSSTGNLVRVSIHTKRLSESSVSWAALPSSLAKLGKQVMKQRDAAQTAATEAIQEASAADTLLRCLSVYSELSASAKEDNPQPAVEQYLTLHSSLCASLSVSPPEEAAKVSSEKRKQARAWVQAALSTDLSPFSVHTAKNNALLVVTEAAKPQGVKPRPATGGKAQKAPAVAVAEWERGSGAEEAGELAEKLRVHSQEWFLGFVERFLDADVDSLSLSDNGQIAGMLTQLKSVNQWLDHVSLTTVPAETIERLRKKIYDYLLTHVESAAAALGAGASPNSRK